MARKGSSKLNATAVKVGTALGRADRRAHVIAGSTRNSVNELRESLMNLTEAADRLARDLRKTSDRLKKILR